MSRFIGDDAWHFDEGLSLIGIRRMEGHSPWDLLLCSEVMRYGEM